MNCTTKMLAVLIAAAALAAGAGLAAGQDAPKSPAPPPGQIWVYPQGVFPDDFYALWLAVNGAPYTSGDLPFPFYSVSDSEPGARPVFVGKPDPSGNWTVVLKARRLKIKDDRYVEGAFTAFNLGLAAGTQIAKGDPVPPVRYMLVTDQSRFSTGFGDVLVKRPVEIVGQMTPGGKEQFFGYTPNFDPAASPDTNPAFDAQWLPESYPCGSEYEPGVGYGVRSTKSVVYGGYAAFHVLPVNVDLSVRDCLLYGQYGMGIRINNGPNRTVISNVDIRHTYHSLMLLQNKAGMFTWAINIQGLFGGGGKHLIDACTIDQSPTWQEYHFGANLPGQPYTVGSCPGSHAVWVSGLSKESPDDFVRIENSTFTNCGSNCIVYSQSNLDFHVANCVIDGGYFPYSAAKYSALDDWRGNCIIVDLPFVDQWNNSPVIEIVQNQLLARGWSAFGARLFGCSGGEVTIADNTIMCASASPVGYAGGVQLNPSGGVGSNGNTISRNTIQGTGGWAIDVKAFHTPCERNAFIANDLARFSAQEAGAVFFDRQANYNYFSGDPGAGIIDLGTGNVVVKSP